MAGSGTHLRRLRASDGALAVLAILGAAFVATLAESGTTNPQEVPSVQENRRLVDDLGLTDLSLFTEARYTRHLSQADRHTAFQDHPLAFEHFPSGALLGPPPALVRSHANLD